MGSIGSTDIGKNWVSTISIYDLPYRVRGDYGYETCVFGPGGAIEHTERISTEEEAKNAHERVVAELTAGTFEPNGKNWTSFRYEEN